jgi:hypothetical protein
MIVKVHLSVDTNVPGEKPGDEMLVYNKDRNVKFMGKTDPCIIGKMKGRPKAFFHAKVISEGGGKGKIEIGGEAPWQNW